jgi:hypothetical protein
MKNALGCWVGIFAALMLGACGSTGDDGDDAGGADGDTDSDSDADADAGADGGGDPDCPNPEVADDGTGLDWLTCRAGQCYLDGACAWTGGEVVATGWDAAVAACPSGSRLAEAGELMGLLGNCTEIDLTVNVSGTCDACPASAPCNAIYPGVDALDDFSYEVVVWTATELSDTKAWSVNLKTGDVATQSKEVSMTAICVGE